MRNCKMEASGFIDFLYVWTVKIGEGLKTD